MRHAEGASAVRSTEALAQPAARRPERSEGHAPKIKPNFLILTSNSRHLVICSNLRKTNCLLFLLYVTIQVM
ncbi:MAG: hypothetical protein NZ455_15830 [Bacteroidia bacterium]|nr:hypothetical protein [Bacteroidia bacterium]